MSLFLLTMLWAASTALRAAEAPTAELFFREFAYSDAEIAPDGRHIALLEPALGTINVAIFDLQTMQGFPLTGHRQDRVTWVEWLDPGRLLYGLRTNESMGLTYEEFVVTGIDGGDRRFVGGEHAGGRHAGGLHPGVRADCSRRWTESERILHLLPQEPDYILIESTCAGPSEAAVYRVNVKNGRRTRTVRNLTRGARYLTDPSGAVRVATGLDEDGSRPLYYRPAADEGWRLVRRVAADTRFDLLALTTGGHLYAISDLDRDLAALCEVDLETGEVRVLFQAPGVDVGMPLFARAGGLLLGVSYVTDDIRYFYLDSAADRVHAKLSETFAGEAIELRGHDDSRSRWLARVFSDRTPGRFHLIDLRGGQRIEIASAAPWIDSREMIGSRRFKFQTGDGWTVHGRFSAPADNERPPLIVAIDSHAGFDEDPPAHGFDQAAQFFASRGFATLKVAHRGSEGYGRRHRLAGYHSWHSTAVDDVAAATRWVVERGWVDGTRICIYGDAFGGFITLWSLIRHPAVFHCGAIMDAPTDIERLVKYDLTYIEPIPRQLLLRRLFATDDATLKTVSPLRNAERIMRPLLIAHARDAPIVSAFHGRALSASLRRLDREHELHVLADADEDGRLTEGRSRQDIYPLLERFFSEQLILRRTGF